MQYHVQVISTNTQHTHKQRQDPILSWPWLLTVHSFITRYRLKCFSLCSPTFRFISLCFTAFISSCFHSVTGRWLGKKGRMSKSEPKFWTNTLPPYWGFIISTLITDAACFTETFPHNQKAARFNNPEDLNLNSHRHEDLISHMKICSLGAVVNLRSAYENRFACLSVPVPCSPSQRPLVLGAKMQPMDYVASWCSRRKRAVVAQLLATCSAGCAGSRYYTVLPAAAVLTNRLSAFFTLLPGF